MLPDEINPLYISLQTLDLEHAILNSIAPDFLIQSKTSLQHRDYFIIPLALPKKTILLNKTPSLKLYEHHLSVYRNQGTTHKHSIHYTGYVRNPSNPELHYQYHIYFDENFNRNALPYFLVPMNEELEIQVLQDTQIKENIEHIEALCQPFFDSLKKYHHFVSQNIAQFYTESLDTILNFKHQSPESPEHFFAQRKIGLGLGWCLLKLERLSFEKYNQDRGLIEQIKRESGLYQVQEDEEAHVLSTTRLATLLRIYTRFQELTAQYMTLSEGSYAFRLIEIPESSFLSPVPIFDYDNQLSAELSPTRLKDLENQITFRLSDITTIEIENLNEYIKIYEQLKKNIGLFLGKNLHFFISASDEQGISEILHDTKDAIGEIVLCYLIRLSQTHKIYNLKAFIKHFPKCIRYFKYIDAHDFKHLLLEIGLNQAYRDDNLDLVRSIVQEIDSFSLSTALLKYENMHMSLLYLSYHLRKFKIFADLTSYLKIQDFLKIYLFDRSLLEEALFSKNSKYFSVIFNYHMEIFSHEFFEHNPNLVPYLEPYITIPMQDETQKMPLIYLSLFKYLNTEEFNSMIRLFIKKLQAMDDVLVEYEFGQFWHEHIYWKMACFKSNKILNFFLQPPFIQEGIELKLENAHAIGRCFESHIQQFDKMINLIDLCKKYNLRMRINSNICGGKVKELRQQLDKLSDELSEQFSIVKFIKKNQFDFNKMKRAFSLFKEQNPKEYAEVFTPREAQP